MSDLRDGLPYDKVKTVLLSFPISDGNHFIHIVPGTYREFVPHGKKSEVFVAQLPKGEGVFMAPSASVIGFVLELEQ